MSVNMRTGKPASDLYTCKNSPLTEDNVWVLESYFSVPSCRLRNIKTNKIEVFGEGALTDQSFIPLVKKED